MSITLALEPQEVNTVLAGLGELPLKSGLDTWFKIRNQAEQQMQAQQQPPQPADAPAQEPAADAATA